MILVKFKFVKLTHRNRIPKIQPLARAVCVNHWEKSDWCFIFCVWSSGRAEKEEFGTLWC